MARLKQTQRKRVGSAMHLPVDVVAAIAAEYLLESVLTGSHNLRISGLRLSEDNIRRWISETKSEVYRVAEVVAKIDADDLAAFLTDISVGPCPGYASSWS
ncbi:hypothetical protein AgCh_039087 [Apium graveolens]